MAELTASIVLQGRDDASSAIKAVGAALEETKGSAENASGAFERIKAGFESGMGFAAGITGFRELKDVIEGLSDATINFNGQLEATSIRLENLTGSAQGAVETIQAMKELSDASPFTFNELETANERLLRFNFSTDQAASLIKVASDAAAGMGAGASGVDTITEAFGRMNSRTELTTRGIMALIAMGVPAYDMLAKGLGITTLQAEDLTKKGLIPSIDAINILSASLESKYPEMAAKIGGTFDSLKKTIADTMDFMFAELGKPVFDVLENAAKGWLAWLQSADVKEAITEFSQGLADGLKQAGDLFNSLKGPVSDFATSLKTDIGDGLQFVADRLADAGKAWAPWAAQAGDAGKVADDALTGTSDIVQALQFVVQGNFTAAWKTAGNAINDFRNAVEPLRQVLEDNRGLIAGIAIAFGTFTVLDTVVPAVLGASAAFTAMSAAVAEMGGVMAAVELVIGGPLILPLLAVSATVGVVAAAWISNWGDIQGKTVGAADDMKAAWQNLQDAGGILWGIVRDTFLPVQTDLNHALSGRPDSADAVAGAAAGGIKELTTDIRDFTNELKVSLQAVKDGTDALNAFKKGGDDIAIGIHDLIANALNPLVTLFHDLNDWLDSHTFRIKFEIPGFSTLSDGLAALSNIPQAIAAGGQAGSTSAAAAPGGGYDPSSMQMGGGTGGTSAIPAPGDKAGWATFLRNSGAIPSDLINDPNFLNILLTGAQAESGLSGSKTQPTYTDAQGRRAGGAAGLFQFDPGGMGAGLSPDFLNSPAGTLYEAQQIIPKYANAYRSQTAQGMTGAAQAAYVADQAEAPAGAWPGGAGDNNYRAAYSTLAGGAGSAEAYGPNPVYGPATVAGQAGVDTSGTTPLSPAALAELAKGDAVKKAATGDTGTAELGKQVETVGDWLTKSQDTEAKKLAKLDETAATASGKVDTGTADKITDMGTQRSVQDDIKARKDALAESIADDTRANAEKTAADDLTYKRAQEDQQTASSRAREDNTILNNEKLAAQALVHSRTLQDTEIQYQQGLQQQATLHARQIEDEKILDNEKLAAQATVHARALQDAQNLANEQLALEATVHQRKLQDQAIADGEVLTAAATVHSRTLQDAEVVWQAGRTNDKEADTYAQSLANATTDAQRAAATQTHNNNLKNIADQAAEAAIQLAHQRELQDAEQKYQDGLRDVALAKSRSDADKEQAYKDQLADVALQTSRSNADKEALYQQGLRETALVQSRADADKEQIYKDGLAKTALDHSRALQDAEIAYQIGIAHTALMQKRADEDAARADARAKEDADIAHKAQLDAAARQFAKDEKDKQQALDKTLADEAYARQVVQLQAEAEISKKNIADNLILAKQAAVESAQTERDTKKAAFDETAAAIIAKSKTAVEAAGGDFAPIEAVMTATVKAMDASFASAHDNSSAALVDLAKQAADALGTGGKVPSAIGQTSDLLTAAFGTNGAAPTAIAVSDRAVELFAQQFGTSWEVARPLLGEIEQGIFTNMGENGLIPHHIGVSDDAVQAFADKWGVSWDEARPILETESDKIKATFGVDVPAAMNTSDAAAIQLNSDIQAIKDKTVTVTTVYNAGKSTADLSGGNSGYAAAGQNFAVSSISDPSRAAAPSSGAPDYSTYAGRQAVRDANTGAIVDASGMYTPPGKASGGAVQAGQAYTVGEQGPELFTPGTSGSITPHNSGSQGGGMTDAQMQQLAGMIATELAKVIPTSIGINSVQSAILQLKRRGGTV